MGSFWAQSYQSFWSRSGYFNLMTITPQNAPFIYNILNGLQQQKTRPGTDKEQKMYLQ